MEERFFAPFKRNAFAARTWQVVTAAGIVAIYGIGLIFLLRWDAERPAQLAKQEETPVEVVVEKPPPPPQKQAPPKPETKQEIEKPATSAPRAPSEEKVETEKQDKETHAPKAPAPPADGKPDEAKEAASPSETPAEPEKSEEAAEKKPDPTEKEAEALDKAVPLPPKKPVMKEAKVKVPAKLRREIEEKRRLAGLSDLPDYRFAKPTKKSPVYGGSEDSRYLAIVYGMIMQKYRPRAFVPSDTNSVTVTFNVDDGGSVEDIDIRQTSGYPEIDADAIAAIRRAAPFPPPPPGAPHGLIAEINVADGGQHMSTSPRGR